MSANNNKNRSLLRNTVNAVNLFKTRPPPTNGVASTTNSAITIPAVTDNSSIDTNANTTPITEITEYNNNPNVTNISKEVFDANYVKDGKICVNVEANTDNTYTIKSILSTTGQPTLLVKSTTPVSSNQSVVENNDTASDINRNNNDTNIDTNNANNANNTDITTDDNNANNTSNINTNNANNADITTDDNNAPSSGGKSASRKRHSSRRGPSKKSTRRPSSSRHAKKTFKSNNSQRKTRKNKRYSTFLVNQ